MPVLSDAAYSAQYEAERKKKDEETKKLMEQLGLDDPVEAEKYAALGKMDRGSLQQEAQVDPAGAEKKVQAGLDVLHPAPENTLRDTPYFKGTHVLPSGETIPFYTNREATEVQAPGAEGVGTVENLTPYLPGTPTGNIMSGRAPGPLNPKKEALIADLRAAKAGFPTTTAKEATTYYDKNLKDLSPEEAEIKTREDVGAAGVSMDAAGQALGLHKAHASGEHEVAKIKLMQEAEARTQWSRPDEAQKKAGTKQYGPGVEDIINDWAAAALDPENRKGMDLRAMKEVSAELRRRATNPGAPDYLPWRGTKGKQIPATSALDDAHAERQAVDQGLQAATADSVAGPAKTTYDYTNDPEGRAADVGSLEFLGSGMTAQNLPGEHGYGESGIAGVSKDLAAFLPRRLLGEAVAGAAGGSVAELGTRGALAASRLGGKVLGPLVEGAGKLGGYLSKLRLGSSTGEGALEAATRRGGMSLGGQEIAAAGEVGARTAPGLAASATRTARPVAGAAHEELAKVFEGLKGLPEAARTAEGLRAAEATGRMGSEAAGRMAAEGVGRMAKAAPEIALEQAKAWAKRITQQKLRGAAGKRAAQIIDDADVNDIDMLMKLIRGE